MRVIAVKTLKQFWTKHPDATAGLKSWYERVSVATYQNPGEVVADFKGADYVGNTRIVFNVAKNKYRLVAAFRYDIQIVWIKFVGTHSEYDAIDVTTVEFQP